MCQLRPPNPSERLLGTTPRDQPVVAGTIRVPACPTEQEQQQQRQLATTRRRFPANERCRLPQDPPPLRALAAAMVFTSQTWSYSATTFPGTRSSSVSRRWRAATGSWWSAAAWPSTAPSGTSRRRPDRECRGNPERWSHPRRSRGPPRFDKDRGPRR